MITVSLGHAWAIFSDIFAILCTTHVSFHFEVAEWSSRYLYSQRLVSASYVAKSRLVGSLIQGRYPLRARATSSATRFL